MLQGRLKMRDHGNLRPADGAPVHIWRRNLVLFLVDSCIPARQWTDICNTRCSILSLFSHFHVSRFPPLQHGTAFSCPAISCLAFSASPSSPQIRSHGFWREINLYVCRLYIYCPLRFSAQFSGNMSSFTGIMMNGISDPCLRCVSFLHILRKYRSCRTAAYNICG